MDHGCFIIKYLIGTYGEDDYDIDHKKTSLVIQKHLLNNLTIDVGIVITYFFGTMSLN
tara:strand:- start:4886 stop:5059 length:174 start_codon:yes stop_codon:yes gene_type:complete